MHEIISLFENKSFHYFFFIYNIIDASVTKQKHPPIQGEYSLDRIYKFINLFLYCLADQCLHRLGEIIVLHGTDIFLSVVKLLAVQYTPMVTAAPNVGLAQRTISYHKQIKKKNINNVVFFLNRRSNIFSKTFSRNKMSNFFLISYHLRCKNKIPGIGFFFS